MLEVERRRHEDDADRLARLRHPKPDPAPSIIVHVQPLAGPPPSGKTWPRVHRASVTRALTLASAPAATDFPVTVVGKPIVTDLDNAGLYEASLHEGRWYVQSNATLSYAIEFDYLAFTPTSGFSPAATTARKSITLPLAGSLPPELSFLGPSGYTLGTDPSAVGLPLTQANFAFTGGGIPKPSGHFLYDFSLGVNSQTRAGALNYWEPKTGTPTTQFYMSQHDTTTFNEFWHSTFGLPGFVVGQIGGVWKCAQSLRVVKTFVAGGFSFPTPLDLNGAGLIVYRTGVETTDDDGLAVIDFTTIDTFDYYQYDTVLHVWTRRTRPPDQSTFYVNYVAYLEAGGFGVVVDPSTMTPPFATYRVRLRPSV